MITPELSRRVGLALAQRMPSLRIRKKVGEAASSARDDADFISHAGSLIGIEASVDVGAFIRSAIFESVTGKRKEHE